MRRSPVIRFPGRFRSLPLAFLQSCGIDAGSKGGECYDHLFISLGTNHSDHFGRAAHGEMLSRQTQPHQPTSTARSRRPWGVNRCLRWLGGPAASASASNSARTCAQGSHGGFGRRRLGGAEPVARTDGRLLRSTNALGRLAAGVRMRPLSRIEGGGPSVWGEAVLLTRCRRVRRGRSSPCELRSRRTAAPLRAADPIEDDAACTDDCGLSRATHEGRSSPVWRAPPREAARSSDRSL